jgi:hypothetical protein
MKHTTGNIQQRDLRKFFEQKADEIGLDIIKQFFPENVYMRYRECCERVYTTIGI